MPVTTSFGNLVVQAFNRCTSEGETGFTVSERYGNIKDHEPLRYWTAAPNYITLHMPRQLPDYSFAATIREAVDEIVGRPLYRYQGHIGGWFDLDEGKPDSERLDFSRLHLQAAVPYFHYKEALRHARCARQQYIWDNWLGKCIRVTART